MINKYAEVSRQIITAYTCHHKKYQVTDEWPIVVQLKVIDFDFCGFAIVICGKRIGESWLKIHWSLESEKNSIIPFNSIMLLIHKSRWTIVVYGVSSATPVSRSNSSQSATWVKTFAKYLSSIPSTNVKSRRIFYSINGRCIWTTYFDLSLFSNENLRVSSR